MAYVIAEPCIGQKDASCVEVCPVDCIHPTPDEEGFDTVKQLFIDPEECIDCDARAHSARRSTQSGVRSSSSIARSRRSALAVRDFTVPSGTPVCAEICRWLRPRW
jgi:NAD-dependent dihydropyrimidine dehydrogenase PreA subunit